MCARVCSKLIFSRTKHFMTKLLFHVFRLGFTHAATFIQCVRIILNYRNSKCIFEIIFLENLVSTFLAYTLHLENSPSLITLCENCDNTLGHTCVKSYSSMALTRMRTSQKQDITTKQGGDRKLLRSYVNFLIT